MTIPRVITGWHGMLLHNQFKRSKSQVRTKILITLSIEPQPREIITRILSAMNGAKGALPEQPALQPSGAGA